MTWTIVNYISGHNYEDPAIVATVETRDDAITELFTLSAKVFNTFECDTPSLILTPNKIRAAISHGNQTHVIFAEESLNG